MSIGSPLANGKDTTLTSNPGTLPNMQDALINWFQQLSFTMIVKTVSKTFQLVETTTTIEFMGVRQPFTPQQLLIKPEGQRKWLWETIHAFPTLILKPDDKITFNGVEYRVMQKLDWKEYGYCEYHIIQGYTNT